MTQKMRDTDLATCEHEILPHEDAKLIADIVENVRFVDASTPNTDHVLIPRDHEPEPFRILVVSEPTTTVRAHAERSQIHEPCQEVISRDPVRS